MTHLKYRLLSWACGQLKIKTLTSWATSMSQPSLSSWRVTKKSAQLAKMLAVTNKAVLLELKHFCCLDTAITKEVWTIAISHYWGYQLIEKWLRWRFRSAAWNTEVLQGHCFKSRLDPFHLKNNHAKFQLNPLRNGWDIGQRVFKDSAALHGILQCCRVTVLTLWTWSFPPKEQSCKISAESVEKWLRY